MSNIQKDAVCFSVNLSRPSLRRKVRTSQVECDTDKRALHVSKEILESPAFDAIVKLDGEIRTYLYDRCVPSFFRRGIYLLPLKQVNSVQTQLAAYARKRQEYVERLLSEYEEAKEDARERLRALYDEHDYPSARALRKAFSLDYQMFAIDVPDTLQQVNAAAFEEERKKAEAYWAEVKENVASVLRAELKELVDHLVERLDSSDGRPKIFRNSLLENFEDWTKLFADRNLANDSELAGLVDKVKSALTGVNPDDIRDSKQVRDYVKAQFGDIKATADKLCIDKPKRAFDLED